MRIQRSTQQTFQYPTDVTAAVQDPEPLALTKPSTSAHLCAIYIIIAHAILDTPAQLLSFIIAAQPLTVAVQQPAWPDWWPACSGSFRCGHAAKVRPITVADPSCVITHASTSANDVRGPCMKMRRQCQYRKEGKRQHVTGWLPAAASRCSCSAAL
jgi:hypothetical protein